MRHLHWNFSVCFRFDQLIYFCTIPSYILYYFIMVCKQLVLSQTFQNFIANFNQRFGKMPILCDYLNIVYLRLFSKFFEKITRCLFNLSYKLILIKMKENLLKKSLKQIFGTQYYFYMINNICNHCFFFSQNQLYFICILLLLVTLHICLCFAMPPS